MLLCKNQEDCNSAAIDTINEGLAAGYLCIYASILNGNKAHLDRFSSSVNNYAQYIEDGDLVIVDFFKYFELSLKSDLSSFNELKLRIESMISERMSKGKSGKALIFAEAAGALSECRHFDKSINLERWWENAHADWLKKMLNISIICPHPVSILNEECAIDAKKGIAVVHTQTLELQKLRQRQQNLRIAQIHVLIAEPEPDIRTIYSRYLDRLGMHAIVVGTGKEALEHILSKHHDDFDIIMLDDHLKDASAKEIAQQIITEIPDQRIVFTTTSETEELKANMQSIPINSDEVLVKPFLFSKLLELLRPKMCQY
jgi:CheY-like chemotaxis protein